MKRLGHRGNPIGLMAGCVAAGLLGCAGVAHGSLSLNFDASDTSRINGGTISDGQAVTTWGEQYGDTALMGELTATGTPIWNASGLNGLPTITLDGASYFSGSDFGSFIASDNWTVLFVANTTSTGTSSQTLFANPDGFTSTGGGTSLRYRNDAEGWWFRHRDPLGGDQQDEMEFPQIDDDGNPGTLTRSAGRGEVALRGIASDGTQFLGYYNDATPSATALDPGNTTLWDTDQTLYIGTRSTLSWNFIGNVSQVVAFNEQLTGVDLANVQQALSEKWGLGVDFGGDAAAGNQLLQPPPPPPSLVNYAVARTKKPGQPDYGDTAMRTLQPDRTAPDPPHDVFEAIDAFGVTHLLWVYSKDDEQFIQNVVATGTDFGGAISGTGMTDTPGGSTQLIGRDKDLYGNPVVSKFSNIYGDPASDDYRQVLLNYLKLIVDNGGTQVQVDDPIGAWGGLRDKNSGGGYGDAAIIKFALFLDDHTTSQQRSDYGLPVDLTGFDYRDWVLNDQGGVDDTPVRALFESFHREQTAETYAFLKTEINQYAGFYVPFTFNNNSTTDQTSFIVNLPEVDYWLGETSQEFGQVASGGPQNIYWKVKNAESLDMFQMFTGPNDGDDYIPTRNEFLGISRNVFAAAYASGSMMLVPWDKFRKDPAGITTYRFFATEDEFSDLTGLVENNRELFNDHEEVFAVGSGLAPQFAPGLTIEPARLNGAGIDVMLTVRVVPNDPDADMVVHMVDYKFYAPDDAITIDLNNELFNWNPGLKMYARLLMPGDDPIWVSGTLGADGYTTFDIPELLPYGLLAVPGVISGDMNDDRGYTSADIALLQLAVNDPLAFASLYPGVDANTVGDTNGDQVLDGLDIDYLVHSILHTEYGDLNGDGYVGLDDLQPILDHWNQSVTVGDTMMGDISGPGGVPDGYVGLDDLQPVLDHWNEGTPPVPGAIPEPGTLCLLAAGVGLLASGRRRGASGS